MRDAGPAQQHVIDLYIGTLRAATASYEMHIEIFLAVVIGKLFARLDGTECDYINATPTDLDLAIRRARMIDEAGDVRGDVAVDHGRIARPEEILAAVQLHLSGRGGTSDIFDDARALPNALLSEKAPAAVRPVDGKTKGCRHEALLHWAR
ncbi:hypothetical protein HYPGJ_31339 [Hyphomicrobium sp. GJ21]|nr:hypothetical protein HYPGJ_31339 [Hyphomicrobium sp. GJ21]